MTTVQESSNGHRVYPPPHTNSQPLKSPISDLPSPKPSPVDFPASDDRVVERQKGVPIRPLLAHEEALPERCQFFFSDGRQCTMARSDIHPSLCRFHAEREDQLFGAPSPAGYVVGPALDLPELHSACRDLTTVTGVNRALAQVFRLLAQRRISRQEAATFGHLAQLLLRSISLMRSESATASENKQPMIPVVERQKGVAITPLLPHDKVVPRNEPQGGAFYVPSPQHKNGALGRQPAPTNVNSSAPPIAPAPCSEPLAGPTAVKTSLGTNTSADIVYNSSEIST